MATLDESKSVQVGRDYLIVYDAETGTASFNPCQKYRIGQATLLTGGFFTTAFAVFLTIFGFNYFMK